MTDQPKASRRASKLVIPSSLPERVTLTDAQLRAIGLVISEWGRTEHSLFVAASMAFGISPGAEPPSDGVLPLSMLMGAGMAPRTMVGLLKGLMGLAFPEQADEFAKLGDRILDGEKSRDAIAHAAWRKGKRPDSIATLALRAVGEIRLEQREFTVSELEQLADRIRLARRDLIRFMQRRGYYPSPGRPNEPAS